jgi:hypothetical protein
MRWIIAGILVGAVGASVALAQVPATVSFTQIGTVPFNGHLFRWDGGMTCFAGLDKVLLFGGHKVQTGLVRSDNSFHELDLTTGTWSAPLPSTLGSFNPLQRGGIKMRMHPTDGWAYVFGGFSFGAGGNTPVHDSFRVKLNSGSTVTIEMIPHPVGDLYNYDCYYEPLIDSFIILGNGTAGAWVYNPTAFAWTPLSNVVLDSNSNPLPIRNPTVLRTPNGELFILSAQDVGGGSLGFQFKFNGTAFVPTSGTARGVQGDVVGWTNTAVSFGGVKSLPDCDPLNYPFEMTRGHAHTLDGDYNMIPYTTTGNPPAERFEPFFCMVDDSTAILTTGKFSGPTCLPPASFGDAKTWLLSW